MEQTSYKSQVIFDIADRLESAYGARSTIQILIFRAQEDLALRTLDLLPEDGKWPGSNPESRKVAEDRALNADPIAADHLKNIREAKIRLMEINSLIEGLEAQRRAEEWAITNKMASAIGTRAEVPSRPTTNETNRAVAIGNVNEFQGVPPQSAVDQAKLQEHLRKQEEEANLASFLGVDLDDLGQLGDEIPFSGPPSDSDIPF